MNFQLGHMWTLYKPPLCRVQYYGILATNVNMLTMSQGDAHTEPTSLNALPKNAIYLVIQMEAFEVKDSSL